MKTPKSEIRNPRQIRIWKSESLAHAAPIRSFRFSIFNWELPLSAALAFGLALATARAWDGSPDILWTNRLHTSNVIAVACSPDGSWVASGSADQATRLWRTKDGRAEQLIEVFHAPVNGVAFSPDSGLLALVSADRGIVLWDIRAGQTLDAWHGHSNAVNTVAFSPDGLLIVTGSDDHTARLWRVSNSSLVATMSGHSDAVRAVAYSADGQRIATGSFDGTIRFWTGDLGDPEGVINTSNEVMGVAFVPNTRLVASMGASDGMIRLWDTRNGHLLRVINVSTRMLTLAVAPDGLKLAAARADDQITFWRVSDGGEIISYYNQTVGVQGLDISADSESFAYGRADGTVVYAAAPPSPPLITVQPQGQTVLAGTNVTLHVTAQGLALSYQWRARGTNLPGATSATLTLTNVQVADEGDYAVFVSNEGGTVLSAPAALHVAPYDIVWQSPGHGSWVWSAFYTPDGQTVASASQDGTIKLWNASNAALQRVIFAHSAGVNALLLLTNTTLVSSGSDGFIRFWRLADGIPLRAIRSDALAVTALALSPDQSVLAAGGWDGQIKIWRTSDGGLQRTLPGHAYEVNTLDFSPDGAALASGSEDGNVMVWRTADGALQHTMLAPHNWSVKSVLFSPDGSTLMSAGSSPLVKFWNTSDWLLRTNSPGYSPFIYSLRFTPDGSTIMAGGSGAILFLRLSDGTLQKSLSMSHGDVCSLQPAPDQTNLLVGGGGELRLVQGSDGTILQDYLRHHGNMTAEYSPDGTLLGASSDGGGELAVALYQATNGALLRTFPHSRAVALAFSRDGTQLATVNNFSPANLWRVADGTNLLSFCPSNHPGFYEIAFSPDGEFLGRYSGDVLLYRLPIPEPYAVISNVSSYRMSVSRSPARLALALGQNIGLWSVADGTLLRQMPQSGITTIGLAFAPDGLTLAASGQPGQIDFWRTADGAHLFTTPSNSYCGEVWAFTPDGATVLTVSSGQLAWWRVADGALLRVMGHPGPWINQLRFSPDGRFFVVGRSDGTVAVARNPYYAPVLPSLDLKCLGPQPDGRFHFSITSPTGLVYRILISTNFDGWGEWRTVTATNAIMSFTDPACTNTPRRFYRAVTP